MTRRGTKLVALAVGILFVGASTSAALAATSLQSLALQKSDLPGGGYSVFSSKTVSNAQMAAQVKVAKSLFDAHGRITGYEVQYQGTSLRKPTNFFSNIFAYKSTAGAAWDFTQSSAHDLKAAHRVSAASVGQSTVGFTTRIKSGKYNVDIFAIDFHEGKYDATVGLAGIAGVVHIADAVRYAQIVDHRILTSK